MKLYDEDNYPFQSETHKLIGMAMDIHRQLGKGFSETVYQDAFEYECDLLNVLYHREKEYAVRYKDVVLPHRFIADFVIEDRIIVELKARKDIIEEHYMQVLNYLAVSNLQLGLIFNFNAKSLEHRRVIASRHR